jgi:hypothetical protein
LAPAFELEVVVFALARRGGGVAAFAVVGLAKPGATPATLCAVCFRSMAVLNITIAILRLRPLPLLPLLLFIFLLPSPPISPVRTT